MTQGIFIFNDIFVMLNNIGGNTNIYSSLVCSIGGLLYDIESIDKKIWNELLTQQHG